MKKSKPIVDVLLGQQDKQQQEEQRDIFRKMGYRVKGEPMKIYSLRVPSGQREWLRQHPEVVETLRAFIIALMQE